MGLMGYDEDYERDRVESDLEARIAELESKLDYPHEEIAEMQKRIKELNPDKVFEEGYDEGYNRALDAVMASEPYWFAYGAEIEPQRFFLADDIKKLLEATDAKE